MENTLKNNYHGFFTYEGVTPGNGVDYNLSYYNCTMLKDFGEMKKGMVIPHIGVSYELYGYTDHPDYPDGRLDYDEIAIDYGVTGHCSN